MIRAFGLVALVAGVLLAGVSTFTQRGDARAASDKTVILSLGDRVRVDRSGVGCRVTRLAGHGNRAYVDCRRAGALRGTYGTYFGEDKVLVVRFVDARTARVVFRARHQASAKRCE